MEINSYNYDFWHPKSSGILAYFFLVLLVLTLLERKNKKSKYFYLDNIKIMPIIIKHE